MNACDSQGQEESSSPVLRNEKGSVIVIALIILAIMTIAGISATNNSVTESYIIRNTALYQQNLQLAELAASEGLRWILNQTNAGLLDPTRPNDWLNPEDTWDDDPDDVVLDGTNSAIPLAVTNDAITTINDRGEKALNPLRYYFVGWNVVPNNSMKIGQPIWRQGKIVAIYNSAKYGQSRIEVGVKKKF